MGSRIIVMGGLGSRLWSCKEVSSNLFQSHSTRMHMITALQ